MTKLTVSALNHISVPVRDVEEAIRFWTIVLGGELDRRFPGNAFAEVRVGGLLMGLALQSGGWTARAAEYPHYGFTVEPDVLEPLQRRLSDFGIPVHDLWTRLRREALMYFRDPSGNLFELYCPQGYKEVMTIKLGVFGGGTYEVDFEALNYTTWKDPGPNS